MDEKEIEASLDMYKAQLQQVEMGLASAVDDTTRESLAQLQQDLLQLINLTEESLLSLKKSKLLSIIDGSPKPHSAGGATGSTSQASVAETTNADMDAEFLAFQAAIAEDVNDESTAKTEPLNHARQHDTPNGSPITRSGSPTLAGGNPSPEGSTNNEQEDDRSDGDTGSEEPDLDDIVGTKCKAPFSQEWGEMGQHNALVVSVEPLQADVEPKVRVLFCNPTHSSMLPCQFFLEGRCRFTDDECRYSHGHTVPVADLQEFEEPDYSKIKLELKCLAKFEDGLWYKGMVVDVLHDHKVKVMFDAYQNTETLDYEDILPLDSGEEDEEDEKESVAPSGSEEEEDALPVYLWRLSQTQDALGDWEKHTKGIGSKLMAKMGYILGQGLGKSGEGRAEPVPIQLLPQGKSLDKIMELKEQAGDQDLYDVMKKHKRRQKKINKRAANVSVKPKSQNVFDFINRKLRGKKGNVADLVKSSHVTKTPKVHITEKDLKSKTNKDLNIQLLKTHEEIKKVKKEIVRLKESLKRNDGVDKGMANQLRQKISSLESYLTQLHNSESSLLKHKTMRTEHKKLTIF